MNRPIVDINVAPTKQQIRERLEWVKWQITNHPETYDQGRADHSDLRCCCIAGHLASLADEHKDRLGTACKVIGIGSSRRLPWLFSTYWLNTSAKIDHPKATPAEGCRAIDLYLEEIGA